MGKRFTLEAADELGQMGWRLAEVINNPCGKTVPHSIGYTLLVDVTRNED